VTIETTVLRPATEQDAPAIRALIHAVRINPMDLDWRRFVVAVDERGELIGCGQVKVHRDGARELASIAVVPSHRGRGVARATIQRLMAEHKAPLWLMCHSDLVPLYVRFAFREVVADRQVPPYFRRMRRLADLFRVGSAADGHLAVMVWGSDDGSLGQGQPHVALPKADSSS